MFAPYTPLDRCVGKNLTVRVDGKDYTGMMTGIYSMHGLSILVLASPEANGGELHIPLQGTVVTVHQEQ